MRNQIVSRPNFISTAVGSNNHFQDNYLTLVGVLAPFPVEIVLRGTELAKYNTADLRTFKLRDRLHDIRQRLL